MKKILIVHNKYQNIGGEDIAVEFGGDVKDSAKDDGSAEDLINNDLFMNLDLKLNQNKI